MSHSLTSNLPLVKSFLADKPTAPLIDLSKLEHFIFSPLDQILDQIIALTGSWNPVEIYTAHNYQAVKTKFLTQFSQNHQADNPVFDYPLVNDFAVTTFRPQLIELLGRTQTLAHQLKQKTKSDPNYLLQHLATQLTVLKINDDLATCDLVTGINQKNDRLTKLAVHRKYGQLSHIVISKATDVYHQLLAARAQAPPIAPKPALLTSAEQHWLENTFFNATEIAAAFSWSLAQYQLLAHRQGDSGFLVKIDPLVTSIDVRDKNSSGQPTVYIPADRRVSGQTLLSLIGHEIECHARQSMNGFKLFRLGGGSLKIDDETLYEGLAKQDDFRFERRFFGDTFSVPLPFYIQAIVLAQTGQTFCQVFEKILHNLHALTGDDEFSPASLEHAWLITYRIFRGSTDPNNQARYGLTKDCGYLRGFLVDQDLSKLGYGEYNQLAVITGTDLGLLRIFDVEKKEIPYPLLNVQEKYWDQVLKPLFLKQTKF